MKKTEEIFFIPRESAGTDISRVSLSHESALIVAIKGVKWLIKMIDAHIHLIENGYYISVTPDIDIVYKEKLSN
ncbi:hypothetical protein ABES02_24200 [Neobacillus pocheonensis]|uniref:hypothetical protein n=1 Tax=Neobacillus pocheonensis TaxID=363869 RepID=UPI003D284670